jgi:hypothetical protein
MSAPSRSQTPTTFRQWPRFSLRGLLVLITLAAGGFAWFGQWQAAKLREEQAGQWILHHGGTVGEFNGWEIERREWWVRGLAIVVPRHCLYTVQSVYLERKADDTMLPHLFDLPHLQTVDLRESRITDAGMVHLRRLSDLRTLNLEDTANGDAGFAQLSKNRRIEYLWLGDTKLTPASLPQILQNRGLTHLALDGMELADDDAARLGELQKLEVLALRGTKVTSSVVPALQKLPQLKHLYLRGTAVDDSAVPELLKLRLQSLDIRFTQISREGHAKLRQSVQYLEYAERP